MKRKTRLLAVMAAMAMALLSCSGEAEDLAPSSAAGRTIPTPSPSSSHLHVPATRQEGRMEPSCTEDGSYELVTYCLDCGQELSRERKTIPAPGHDLVHLDGKPATCTEPGYTDYDECAVCGYSTRVVIPATGHTNVATREENRVEPTCTEQGSYDLVVYCRDDGAVLASERKTIPALGHNLAYHQGKTPTCTEDGYDEFYACTRCDYSTKETLPALGHDFDEPTYSWVSFPTFKCTARRVCKNDPSHIETEAVEAVYSVTVAETDLNYGEARYTASFENPAFEPQYKEIKNIDTTGKLQMLQFALNSDGQSYSVSASSTNILGNVVVPETYFGLPVTRIAAFGFSRCVSVVRAVLPQSISEIGAGAFINCSNLGRCDIPASVTAIAEEAFYGCSKLNSMYLGDQIQGIGASAFAGCTSLQTINLPATISLISPSAFENCTPLTNAYFRVDSISDWLQMTGKEALKNIRVHLRSQSGNEFSSIAIPDGTLTIPQYAFCNCLQLKDITIPNSVASIGASAFYGCNQIERLSVPFVGAFEAAPCNLSYFFFGSAATSDLVPSSLRTVEITGGSPMIGEHAFDGCSSLTSISFVHAPASVGEGAFSNCGARIALPASPFDEFMDVGGKEHLGSYVSLWDDGKNVTSFAIPDGVTRLEDYAFYNCRSLTSITIPDSVTSIGDCAFYNCTSLTSVAIPDSVTSIGYSAFYGCSSLASIAIPDSVTSIGERAFLGCSSLVSATIGNRVTSIGYSIFWACPSLADISFEISSIEDWLTISEGKSLTNHEVDVHLIHAQTGEEITDVVIPDGVTSIGVHAFENCSSLASIAIPGSVTSIGNSAFENCSSLASIAIPDGVTSIGYDAFYGCASLTSITIPDSVTSIRQGAFENCTSLSSVFYMGTSEQKGAIDVESSNTELTSAAWYYCSETQPTEPGNYWHYVNGVPTPW